MTLAELKQIFPDATTETWHQHKNGGGWIQNTAEVDESARVYGDAHYLTSPLYLQGSRHALNEDWQHGRPVVRIGCHVCDCATWRKKAKALARAEHYTPVEMREYLDYIGLFERHFRRVKKSRLTPTATTGANNAN